MCLRRLTIAFERATRYLVAILTVLTVASLPWPASANAVGQISLHATRIAFYNNLFVVRADGKVIVDLGTGTVLHGDSFAMDVRNSRFVLAGNVSVVQTGATISAVAVSDDLVTNHAYALAIDATGAHTTSYVQSDFRGTATAAVAPADAFAISDVGRLPASFLASGAIIGTDSFIRFSGCRTQIIGGASLYVPLPVCYINFGSDPNLAQDSLSGANVGAGYKFAGNANSTTDLVVNYDNINKLYGALQQNVSSPNAWAVASVYPLGKSDLVYSGIAAVQVPDQAELRVSGQYHTIDSAQPGPYGSYSFADALVTIALPHSSAQFYGSTGNQSVNSAGDAAGVAIPKQSLVQFNLASADLPIGHLPLIANLRAGYGQTQDPFGLQVFNGIVYTSVATTYADVALRAPRLDLDGWFLDLSGNVQREWISVPHTIDSVVTSASLSRSFGHISAYAAYTIQNVGDNYGSLQALAYPAAISVDTGYAAFDGYATFHTLAFGAVYAPRPDVSLTATFRRHVDFPKPYAGFFTELPTPALGENVAPYQLGQPPYDATITARYRINPQLSVDLQDTYYFNFGGRTWSGVQFQVRP